MCGIVGFVGKQSAAPILLKGLQQLEYRGYDSAGIAVMDSGMIRVEKVSGRIARLCEKTENGAAVPGSIGIGHTRWATHGAPTDVNAHPHLSNDGRFAIVHNGIIENLRTATCSRARRTRRPSSTFWRCITMGISKPPS